MLLGSLAVGKDFFIAAVGTEVCPDVPDEAIRSEADDFLDFFFPGLSVSLASELEAPQDLPCTQKGNKNEIESKHTSGYSFKLAESMHLAQTLAN